ncbi:hypothetical protein [Stenotrophomonas sp. SrG]|uniref:hypothetical protein n=1 Tax=Stenotrophomonas sp. SrG TaxID=3414430 RepID=UPI003CE9731A
MRLSDIPDLEQTAIKCLLEAKGVPEELGAQLGRVIAIARTESRVGVYVDFIVGSDAIPLSGEADFEIEGLSATGADGFGVEFILFVRGGFLSVLEVYTVLAELPCYASLTLTSSVEVRVRR